MPAWLLDVGDHLSLELDETDLQRTGLFIRKHYPEATSRAAGICRIYSIGGCKFTFQNEWDDPCLISHSDEGDAILMALYAELTSG